MTDCWSERRVAMMYIIDNTYQCEQTYTYRIHIHRYTDAHIMQIHIHMHTRIHSYTHKHIHSYNRLFLWYKTSSAQPCNTQSTTTTTVTASGHPMPANAEAVLPAWHRIRHRYCDRRGDRSQAQYEMVVSVVEYIYHTYNMLSYAIIVC